jgi:hypothetical protein
MADAPNLIIQQGIENLQRHNDQANADLTKTLQEMRERLQTPYLPPVPTQELPPLNPQDDFHYQRILLYGSQWNSEVVAAAALDKTFKDEISERAKTVLRAHGMLPALTNEVTTPVTTSS